MKCFCPVNGLYCKNPEYARFLPPREKSRLTREKPRPRLNFAISQVRSITLGGSCTEPCVLVLPHERFRKKMAANFTITCHGGNG